MSKIGIAVGLATVGALLAKIHGPIRVPTRKALTGLLFILILCASFAGVFGTPVPTFVGPSVIDSSTELSFQRKAWTAAGRFWVGYSDGNGASDDWLAMLIKSTPIGADDWYLEPTAGGHRDLKDGEGYNFAICYEDPYVHIVKAWDDTGVFPTLSYRRGIPQEDGSITWSASWQEIEKGDSLRYNWYPMITVDSDGYAHVTSQRRTNGNWGAAYFVNANNDGTWSGASSGFLKLFGFNQIGVGVPVALGDDIYYIYRGGNADGNIYSRKWNGTLQAESIVASDAVTGFITSFSAVEYDGKIYLGYSNNGAFSYLRIFNTTSWTDAVGLFGGYGAPVLSVVGEQIWSWRITGDDIWVRKWDDGFLGASTEYISGTSLNTSEINSFFESVAHAGISWTEHGSDDVWFAYEGMTPNLTITNREIGANIVKADYKEYEILVSFDDQLGINIPDDTIGVRFELGGRTYYIYYDVETDTISTTNSSHMYVRNPTYTVFNTSYSELVFYWYPLSYMVDTANVDFYVMGNTSTFDLGWALAANDYVDFLSYSGVSKFTTVGTAGRITGGDWLNLYADKDSSARVEYIDNNIQAVLMSLSLNPAYGWTNAQERVGGGSLPVQKGNFTFGIDYSVDGIGWIEGWKAEIWLQDSQVQRELLPAFVGKNYMQFTVDWYNRGNFVKREQLVGYFWGFDSGDDRVNFIVRFWFNRENGSSVAGGWISPKEYGVWNNGFSWWTDWRPVTTVGANDTQCVKSFYFDTLLDQNGNEMSYKAIDTVRFWANVSRSNTGDVGQQYRIESIETQDIVKGGRQDSHAGVGIPTPAPIQPVFVLQGFASNIVKWIATTIQATARFVSNVFLAGMDGLLLVFTGQEGLVSSLMRSIGVFAGGILLGMNLWLVNVSGYIVTHMIGFFGIISVLLTNFFSLLSNLIGPATFIWNSGARFFGMADALFGGKIYIAPSGQIWDFTTLSGFNFFGYPAFYGIFAVGLAFYTMFLPLRFGVKLFEGDMVGAINVFAEPLNILWKITWLLFSLISLPLRLLNWLVGIFSKLLGRG